MDSSEREELTARTSILKAELKTWERDFAAANDGKKASREDIKNDSEIAAKYKEYNKARDLLSGKVVAPPAPRETPRKRKHAETVHIVSKRQQIAATPSKKTPSRGPLRPWELDPYDSPSVIRSLFTPSKKALGPTPQKEGQVLGLFDLLEGSVGRTPSKVEAKSISLKGPVAATPRKSRTQELGSKYSKTPGSLSKRRMLDAFSTPLKNRDEIGEEGGKTPSTVSKLVFSTPSFLRRDSHRIQLPTVNENEDGSVLSPQMIRVPRKPLVRGLSSMLAGLRKMEEEAADDDLEALHEMEMDMSSQTQPGPAPKPKLAIPALAPPVDIVEDSQNALLSAFDDEAKYDSDASASKDPMVERDSQLKIYKKKGQKRTTRRVNMKPTRSKPSISVPSALSDLPEHSDDDEDELSQHHTAIPDTAYEPDTREDFTTTAGNYNSDDTQSEYTASEGGTRYRRPDQSKKSKRANKDGKIKTAARKVTAMANQNFKRLKLRNSGSKGTVHGHGSRFRRKK